MAERSFWRDADLSARHRTWGEGCPATDIDGWIVGEYKYTTVVALIEYKRFTGQFNNNSNFKALQYLTQHKDGEIPLLLVFYQPEDWSVKVIPKNQSAKEWFTDLEIMSELDYVTRLYEMRRSTITPGTADKLNRTIQISSC